MTSHQLLEIIENKRKELFSVVSENGISSQKALMCSQQLDELINKYVAQSLNQARV